MIRALPRERLGRNGLPENEIIPEYSKARIALSDLMSSFSRKYAKDLPISRGLTRALMTAYQMEARLGKYFCLKGCGLPTCLQPTTFSVEVRRTTQLSYVNSKPKNQKLSSPIQTYLTGHVCSRERTTSTLIHANTRVTSL